MGIGNIKYAWSDSPLISPSASSFKNVENNEAIRIGLTSTNVRFTFNGGNGLKYLWIIAEDILGNKTTTVSGAFNFDNKAPEVNVHYSKIEPSNESVEVIIEADEDIRDIDGWSRSGNNFITIDSAKPNKYLWKTYPSNTTETLTVTDIAGNTKEVNIKIANIDKVKPTLSIMTPNTSTEVANIDVRVIVEDLGGSGLSENNSYQYQLGNTNTTPPTGEWKNYISGEPFNIGSGENGTKYLWVKQISDKAGNKSEGFGEYHISRNFIFNSALDDTENPYINSIKVTNPNSGTYKSGQSIIITSAYNEEIKGTVPTLKLKFGTGAERTIVAGTIDENKINYTYTIQAGDNGIAVITGYTGGTITDMAGNQAVAVSNMVNTGNQITADTTKPTAIITANPSENPTTATSITYTITFSEPVIGFTTDDIIVTNGTKGLFTKINDTTYTLVVSNEGNVTQVLNVGAGACTDIAGNENTIASKTITINKQETEKDSNNNLATMTIDEGILSPVFNANTLEYVVTVENTVENVQIGATLASNKSEFETGYGPRQINLEEGANTVAIKVKAENGTVKTYTITITRREPSSNDDLTTQYIIDEKYITNISPETTKKVFLEKTTSNNEIKIYNREGQEITTDTVIIETGAKLKIGQNEYTLIVKGDVTGDGKITLTDLSRAKSHYVGIAGKLLEAEYLKALDVDLNGKITLTDLSIIKQVLVGLKII